MMQASSQLQIHAMHIVLFAVWLIVFAAIYVRQRFWTRHALAGSPVAGALAARLRGMPGAIGACTIIAGAVHLDVISEHFREAILYGTFFLALTIVQFAFAGVIVWRPSSHLYQAGAIASLAIVLLWLATRTTGIPLGPAAGETEPVGALDLVASIAELATALLCFAALANRRRAVPPDRQPLAA